MDGRLFLSLAELVRFRCIIGVFLSISERHRVIVSNYRITPW